MSAFERTSGHELIDDARGDVRGNISRRIVQLHKGLYGRGPTKAKTYVNGDLVTVLMGGGFTWATDLLDEHTGRKLFAD
jgi:uncharacterized protein YbcI